MRTHGWPDSFPPLQAAPPRGRRLALTLALLLALVLLGAAWHDWHLATDQRQASHALGLNFDFLWRSAGVGISESRIGYTQEDSFLWLILAGLVNTLSLVLPSCAMAVLAGVVIGALRLSEHPLLATASSAWVQLIRNTPLLLQILMWYAVLLKLPSVAHSYHLGDWFFLNHRGAFFPSLSLASGWPQLVLPQRGNFNFSGGATVSLEYFTLFVALSVYTSAYIAEIVRGGVLSVSRGQWLAARALGMGHVQSLRLIVLPQAWRAILPPLVSQVVNVIKNSSLAIAVGFPDLLWSLTTVIGVTNRTIESVLLLFVLYLLPSLAASWLLGILHARLNPSVAIHGRDA